VGTTLTKAQGVLCYSGGKEKSFAAFTNEGWRWPSSTERRDETELKWGRWAALAIAPEVRTFNLVNNEKQFELQPEVAAGDRHKAWSGQGECCGRLPTTTADYDDTAWDETVTST
jgi:hypothetical protein